MSFDPLLDDIKRTLTQQQNYINSRWNQEVMVPVQIYERFYHRAHPQNPPKVDLHEIFTSNEIVQGLFNYIKNAFDKCQNAKEQQLMIGLLQLNISNSIHNKTLDLKDWNKMPLPILPREKHLVGQPHMISSQAQLINQQPQSHNQQQNMLNMINSAPTLIFPQQGQYGYHNKQELIAQSHSQQYQSQASLQAQNLKEQANILNQIQLKFANRHKSENKRPLQMDYSENIERQQQKKLKTGMSDKNDENVEIDYEKWNIVGTCQDIEKPYLRLTKEPSPDQVRPEEVLKKSLKLLLNKWKNRDCEYQYIQDQFRSIRQDLVIQHIRNEFTAKVCENNARICLEVDDIGQYMQCCATLFDLYQIGIQGEKEEFYCYKIIDYGFNIQQNYELSKIIYEIQSFIDHPLIQFAIDLIDTYNQGNVYKFYQMYEKSPNMCQCIIERNITRLRLWGLSIISKSFQQKMSLANLTKLMKFQNLDHTKEFITSCGAKLDEKGENLLLKESWKGFYEAYQNI